MTTKKNKKSNSNINQPEIVKLQPRNINKSTKRIFEEQKKKSNETER